MKERKIPEGGKAMALGLNHQAAAAMSLFLQYITYKDFQYIAFEQPGLKDFDLFFSDGHKIVCEAKAYNITLGVVKKILDGLVDNNNFSVKDEVLIICKKVSNEAKQITRYIKYLPREDINKLKEKGFTPKHIDLLAKVNFWEIESEVNEALIFSMFSHLLNIWIPEQDLQDMARSILMDKIYKGTQKGGILTKEQFFNELNKRKKTIMEDSGYYIEEAKKIQDIEKVINDLDDPKSLTWSRNAISNLTQSPDLYFLVLKNLEKRNNLILSEWNNLWIAASKGYFSTEVFNIFKKNLAADSNESYLINLMPQLISQTVSYGELFFATDIVILCKKIIDTSHNYDEDVFNVIKQLIDFNDEDLLYIKDNDSDKRYNTDKIAGLLYDLFKETENKLLKENIVSYIETIFNIVADDGQYWFLTPNYIYDILKLHIDEDPFNRLPEFIKILINQYNSFYRKFGKGLNFTGWELMGSGISNFGGVRSIQDRHFITRIITPILSELFRKDPEKTWDLITEKFITLDERKIDKNRPDFLNRSVVPMLINDVYTNSKLKESAKKILFKFIRMKRGIPHKTEIIFQSVLNSNLDNDDKWELVKVQLEEPDYNGLPANAFVEAIVNLLASVNYQEAVNTIEAWINNPNYSKTQRILDSNITKSVINLLNSNNPETQRKGINILSDFLKGEYFIKQQGLWDVWDIAKALCKVLEISYQDGRQILIDMSSKTELSRNEQVILTSSISDIEVTKSDLLLKVYQDIVSNWLDNREGITGIIKKFPSSASRMTIVQFAQKLADCKLLEPAFNIAKIFIDDPDPVIEDIKDKQNLHKQIEEGKKVAEITSVRGWVCWILQKVSVLEGRELIPEVIPLVKKLSMDSNYYVRAQVCIPLEQLARIRHTVMPNNPNTRFISLDDAIAIEKIAFLMLRDETNWSLNQVMSGLVKIFSNIRALTDKEALEVIEIFMTKTNSEVKAELSNLLIYYAEFREETAKDEKFKLVFGEKRWNELNNFDSTPFKKILIAQLKGGDAIVRESLAGAFWRLSKEDGIDYKKRFTVSIKYLKIIAELNYDRSTYTDLYYFIGDNMEKMPDQCIQLWKSCIQTERPYIKKQIEEDKHNYINFWSYHNNGDVLALIARKEGYKEFLIWLDYLLDYPAGVTLSTNLDVIVDILLKINPDDNSKEVFTKFTKRFPQYFEIMKNWLAKESI